MIKIRLNLENKTTKSFYIEGRIIETYDNTGMIDYDNGEGTEANILKDILNNSKYESIDMLEID
ncbi:hypothetical protein CF087_17880 [Clostridium botulinum]|uniref:hypothetical protein n=1 Tax=Clostridium botulinum TaxID=1491 RepID=UPI000773A22A|nr:hypothetical protein [Clostridium botulinum]AUN01416.1 hypothetical protein RSJ19_00095 [Clostridium botulinum]MBN3352004.1 hypothetical protein [Clostridium botulinum]MBN3375737.1 hypothetical protein [Clostridium botulinum]